MAAEDTVRRALKDFITAEVVGPGVAISDEVPLADIGVDSFALMEVVLFVERRFGVVLPVEQLTRDNVRSVAALGRCVTTWMPSPG